MGEIWWSHSWKVSFLILLKTTPSETQPNVILCFLLTQAFCFYLQLILLEVAKLFVFHQHLTTLKVLKLLNACAKHIWPPTWHNFQTLPNKFSVREIDDDALKKGSCFIHNKTQAISENSTYQSWQQQKSQKNTFAPHQRYVKYGINNKLSTFMTFLIFQTWFQPTHN